jgi:hypothetical protein
MSSTLTKPALVVVLLSAMAVPAFAQGDVLPGFVTVVEGFTSANRTTGIVAAYRMFSLPALAKTCEEAARPFKLVAPNAAVPLHLGERFPLSRLVVVGVDRTGHVLRPVPIMIEVDSTNPLLLNLRTDMISDGHIWPIATGKFRFRVRTICEGTSADVFIQAVVRPK